MTKILTSINNPNDIRQENGSEFNLTQLTVDKEIQRFRFTHRDFVAHAFRYSHAAMVAFKMKSPTILDIGCGVSWHQLVALHSNGCHPSLYLGVDARDCSSSIPKVGFPSAFAQANIVESLPAHPEGKPWNLIICFEVLEHMSRENGVKLLQNIASVMSDNTTVLFSTPCYDAEMGMSEHHLYEWRWDELYAELSNHFTVADAFGTFASQKDYKAELDAHPELKAAVETLKKYYNSALMACIMAPLFPSRSRNCLWHLKKKILEQNSEEMPKIPS